MKPAQLQENLYWQLLQVLFRVKHQLMKLADRHGLTVMQMYTLCALEPDQPATMNYFASLLACDASNVTGIVERLFTLGHIVREENPHDRRVRMVTITAKGEALRRQILRELPSYDPGILSKLDDIQKQELSRILTAVS